MQGVGAAPSREPRSTSGRPSGAGFLLLVHFSGADPRRATRSPRSCSRLSPVATNTPEQGQKAFQGIPVPALGQTTRAGLATPPPPPRRGAWRRSPPLRASEPRTAGRTGGLLGFLSFSRAATCYSGDQASAAPGIPSRSRVAGGACHSPWCQPRDPAACSWENGRRPWPGPSGRGSSCGVLWAQSRGGFSGLAPCPGGQPGSGSPVLGPGKPGGRAGPGGRGGACLPGVGRRPRA